MRDLDRNRCHYYIFRGCVIGRRFDFSEPFFDALLVVLEQRLQFFHALFQRGGFRDCRSGWANVVPAVAAHERFSFDGFRAKQAFLAGTDIDGLGAFTGLEQAGFIHEVQRSGFRFDVPVAHVAVDGPDNRTEPAKHSPSKHQIDESDWRNEAMPAAGGNEQRNEISNEEEGRYYDEPLLHAGKIFARGFSHGLGTDEDLGASTGRPGERESENRLSVPELPMTFTASYGSPSVFVFRIVYKCKHCARKGAAAEP